MQHVLVQGQQKASASEKRSVADVAAEEGGGSSDPKHWSAELTCGQSVHHVSALWQDQIPEIKHNSIH